MKLHVWAIGMWVMLGSWVGVGQPAVWGVRVPKAEGPPIAKTEPSRNGTQIADRDRVPDWARLVDMTDINPSIILDMRYATANNFLNRELYPVARCALRASVAEKLSRVQNELQQRGLGLKVFDCYRPFSVTEEMWEVLPDPRYVANPAWGSRHNRGAAVDLTLVDREGRELEMPTEFDDFTERAARDYRGPGVSETARRNSELLAAVMRKHGFVPLVTEWWHFDAADWRRFSILDVSLEAIPSQRGGSYR